MFYIRIAHNKRLRDVNIVCARLLIRCACCCKIGSFSCSIQLSLDFFLYFSSLSRRVKLQFWSVSSALFNVHCELIMLVCVILNRFLSCIRTFHLFRFFRFGLYRVCSVFGATLQCLFEPSTFISCDIKTESVFVHIASDSLFFPVDSIPKVEYRNEQGIFDSFLSLAPPIQMRRHPQKQRNVFIIMGRLECIARIIKYAGVQLFVTIIIIKNTYFSCVRCS